MDAERMERYHLKILMRVLGRSAIYRRPRRKGVSVTVIPLETGNDRIDFGGLPVSPDSKVFLIGSEGIPEPKKDDAIELDGKKWKVTPIEDGLTFLSHGHCGLAYKIHVRKA